MNKNFTIFYHEIRDDLSISEGARLLYTFIEPLTRKYGRCFASNDFFQEKMGITKKTLLKRLNELEEAGYVYRVVCKKKSDRFKSERHLFVNYDSFIDFISKNESFIIVKKTEDISSFKEKGRFEVEECEEKFTTTDGVKSTPAEGGKSTPTRGGKSTPHNNITNNNNITSNNNIKTSSVVREKTEEEEEEVGTRLSKGFKDEVLKTWNDINSMDNNFSKIRTISEKRAKKLRSLAKKYSEEEILKAIDLIKRSSFLRGKNERGWSADVDWFLIENNFLKILEEKYTDKKSNKVMALERQEEREKKKEANVDYQRMKDILRKRKGLI